MKRHMRIFGPLCIVLGVAVALIDARGGLAETCGNHAWSPDRETIMARLRSGGFSGALDDQVELRQFGVVNADGRCLTLVIYVHTSQVKGEPIGAQHMAIRLLIFSDSTYLGMYPIDELPTRIDGNVVEFPGEKAEGNSIVFRGGKPPEKAYLGGEVRPLFK